MPLFDDTETRNGQADRILFELCDWVALAQEAREAETAAQRASARFKLLGRKKHIFELAAEFMQSPAYQNYWSE